jgi:hypothetical protein
MVINKSNERIDWVENGGINRKDDKSSQKSMKKCGRRLIEHVNYLGCIAK